MKVACQVSVGVLECGFDGGGEGFEVGSFDFVVKAVVAPDLPSSVNGRGPLDWLGILDRNGQGCF